MFTLRFDMQAPAGGAPARELYAAALEMAEWADEHGAMMVLLSEHHATADGYLPSPVVMASAMAARTARVPIWLMVAILPFYDPIRLAEDLCVLDVLSDGRVSLVAGLGYRREEYDVFGVDFSSRGQRPRRSSNCSCGPRPASRSSTAGSRCRSPPRL
ncbi:MAG: LLM class flavin-dependent oxidoreductase [Microthrixaceae bacterium]|nr:LLM class flavin-dependent oxidoreductase [Microthrixaceae bacterium]